MKLFQEGNIFIAEGEDKDFGCCKCSHIIQKNEDGFHCLTIKGKNKNPAEYRIFCEACQNDWDKTNINTESRCHLDAIQNNGEHIHTRFIRK
jgi:hypothetical protein